MRRFDPHPDTPEHSTEAGARALAERIAAFWAERGFEPPKCRVESCEMRLSKLGSSFFGVRSDLGAGGGLPPAGKSEEPT